MFFEVWVDLKNKIKKKAAESRYCQQRTGGGLGTAQTLSELEERVIHILSKELVYGIEGTDSVALENSTTIPGGSSERQPTAIPGGSKERQPTSDIEEMEVCNCL